MNYQMIVDQFLQGKSSQAYLYFGAHIRSKSTVFRTYAPGAVKVNIFGDFNGWEEEPMKCLENGIYEFESSKAKKGTLYKYVIYGNNGYRMEHSDPYGFGVELRPGSASRIVDLSEFCFQDEEWQKKLNCQVNSPMSIYELHFGSWKKNPKDENGWYSYRELAKPLITYVKKTGFTHIEVMPLSEHPFDGSWGYQLTGYFAPTSRYGSASDLKYFINECHKAGIGVIMDFVPVHFAVDDYALKLYDSTPLYEYYPDGNQESQWGSCMFHHERKETTSFLISAANYWIEEFHFDGLRMDAVSNLVYCEGDRNRGENQAGLQFVRTMNTILKKKHPGVMLFAEDSSGWCGGVTKPVEEGGLGFDYKWNMGWMYDSLHFLSSPVAMREDLYHKMTFSMWYFYDDRYLLSLSHDEVVGGAKTIVEKMPGNEAERFEQARAYYMYMLAHPGKKLIFMGDEIGEQEEWNEKRSIMWEVLKQPLHAGLYQLMQDLHKLYRTNEAFYDREYEREQFEWLYWTQGKDLCYVMKRNGTKKSFVIALNFGNLQVINLDIALSKTNTKEKWKPILQSNDKKYGGKEEHLAAISSQDGHIFINLMPFSGVIYEVTSK